MIHPTTAYRVLCDFTLDADCELQTPPAVDAEEAERRARAKGWKQDKAERWACPNCQKKRPEFTKGEGMQSKIVGVAIQARGVTYHLPWPCRHPHIICMLAQFGFKANEMNEQGFIDGDDNYLNREDGLARAIECNQLKGPKVGAQNILFSEDLW